MHLKRHKSPKSWPIARKGSKYLVRPLNNLHQGIPLLILIRDMLGLAKNKKEVKKALSAQQISLNHKKVFDERSSALLFDVLTIYPSKNSKSKKEKHYRIYMDKDKKFNLKEISSKESENKISKIIGKKTLKNQKIQINLSDGMNFISDIKCKTNDSILVNLVKRKIEKCIPLKKGAKVVVFAGKHAGKEGTIKKIDDVNKIVEIEKNNETINVLIKQLIVTE